MLILGQIALPQTTIDIFVIASVLLAIIGTLFLAYDLLGRENGPLRWFTLVITCGLVSSWPGKSHLSPILTRWAVGNLSTGNHLILSPISFLVKNFCLDWCLDSYVGLASPL